MNKKLLRQLVASICAGMAGAAIAADAGDSQKMGEVTVTATKSVKDTSEAPATVSVVTASDIETMNIHSPDESLKFLPGVYATRPGGHEPSVMSTNVLLRGIPDYSRTLVLVDGQSLNDPYIGAVTWESVVPETIERIEVVPGPFSSLYGGSAMGGVINIITKSPTKKDLLFKVGYGTNNLKSGTFVYQDKIAERVGIVFDYGYKESDGFIKDEVLVSPSGAGGTPVTGWQRVTDPLGATKYLVGDKGDSPWKSQNIGMKLHLDLPSDSKLVLGASRFSYEKEWDRFNTYLRDASGNPVSSGNLTLSGAGANVKLSESSFLAGPNPKIQNRYTMDFDTKLAKGASLKATLGYTDIPTYDYVIPFGTFGGGTGKRLHRPNNELAGTIQLSLPVADQHFVVAGVSAGKRKIETFEYNPISDWRDVDLTGTITHQTRGEDRSYAAYAQDEISFTNQLTAYLGGRYDYWTTNGTVDSVSYNDRSKDHFSPKASLVYRPEQTTTLRASVGNAFHAPNLRDTFGWWTPATGKTFVPNPDLKPETVTSWEAGAEKQLGTGTLLRATYYENRLKDLIYRTSDATTESVANAGKATVKGIELEVRQKILDGLTAFANLTYNDARITENPVKPTTEGKRMTNTPQKLFNIGLQGARGPWSGSLMGHYVGKVYGNDLNADTGSGVYGSYDAYFTADAKLSYKVKDKVTVSLSANNLADRKYYESTLAQGRAYYGEIVLGF